MMYIQKNNIAAMVADAVNQASVSIAGTHAGAALDLPVAYAAALKEKAKTLPVRRVLFGGTPARGEWDGFGETRVFSDAAAFQRMILIDGRKLFFGIEREGLAAFFVTEDSGCIADFSAYFEECWSVAGPC